MSNRLHDYAHRAQQRVDRSVAKRDYDSDSEDEKQNKRSGKKKKKAEEKPRSWKYDEEYKGLIVPVPAFTEPSKGGADEDVYREWKFEKRKRDFDEEREKQEEFARSKAKQHEDEVEFDDKMALLGEEKAEEPEERDVVERDFADDAIRFDYESGKVIITRPLKPSWFADYNIFRPDDTVVLNGKRRTGKSFMMRKILYEMRHCFEAGVVFTATKHNGFWQQMVPDRFIHETLDVNVIKKLLDQRAATIQRNLLRFGPQYKDKLFYFVVLDDMVRHPLQYPSESV